MKLNADKCRHLVLGQRSVTAKTGNTGVVSSSVEKLLRVHINSKLLFDHDVSKLYKKLAINFVHLPSYPRMWIRTN